MTGWSYYKQITVSASNVDADLGNFPLLVACDPGGDGAELAAAKADGADIRFTLDDGTTELDYYLEQWSGGGGSAATMRAWVKVPSILSATGATIRCYYGNASAESAGVKSAPWTGNGYVARWALDEASGTIYDSLGTHNSTAETNLTYAQAGPIYRAVGFAGDGEIVVPHHAALNVGTDDFTLEGWAYCNAGTAGLDYLLRKWDTTLGYRLYHYATNERLYARLQASDSELYFSADGAANEAWNHFACVRDSGDCQLFLNGGPDDTGEQADDLDNTADFRIGTYWDGKLAEVRVSDVARTAEWLKFQYANIDNAGWEQTWGDEVATATGRLIAPILKPLTHTAV